LVIFTRSANHLKHGASFFSATWSYLEAKFARIVAEMNDLKVLVETQANARELGQAQEGRTSNDMHFAELLQQSKEARLLTEEGFENLEREVTHRQKHQILKWLSAADARSDQDHLRNYRTKTNSGHWLLQNKLLQAWVDPTSDSEPLLWVTGIPGAGKHSLKSTQQFESSHNMQVNPYLRLAWLTDWQNHRAQPRFFSSANMTIRKEERSSEWLARSYINSF
jgi:hypothetical protein